MLHASSSCESISRKGEGWRWAETKLWVYSRVVFDCVCIVYRLESVTPFGWREAACIDAVGEWVIGDVDVLQGASGGGGGERRRSRRCSSLYGRWSGAWPPGSKETEQEDEGHCQRALDEQAWTRLCGPLRQQHGWEKSASAARKLWPGDAAHVFSTLLQPNVQPRSDPSSHAQGVGHEQLNQQPPGSTAERRPSRPPPFA